VFNAPIHAISPAIRELAVRRAGPLARARVNWTGSRDPRTTLKSMRWLVDGMNVIGTRPDAWWKDRDAAMLRLVDQLERWAANDDEDVTVVFERPPSPPIRSTVIDVAHAPKPKRNAADDEIVRRLRADADPGAVRVVTSDRWLADRAWAAGASVEGSDSFRTRLETI